MAEHNSAPDALRELEITLEKRLFEEEQSLAFFEEELAKFRTKEKDLEEEATASEPPLLLPVVQRQRNCFPGTTSPSTEEEEEQARLLQKIQRLEEALEKRQRKRSRSHDDRDEASVDTPPEASPRAAERRCCFLESSQRCLEEQRLVLGEKVVGLKLRTWLSELLALWRQEAREEKVAKGLPSCPGSRPSSTCSPTPSKHSFFSSRESFLSCTASSASSLSESSSSGIGASAGSLNAISCEPRGGGELTPSSLATMTPCSDAGSSTSSSAWSLASTPLSDRSAPVALVVAASPPAGPRRGSAPSAKGPGPPPPKGKAPPPGKAKAQAKSFTRAPSNCLVNLHWRNSVEPKWKDLSVAPEDDRFLRRCIDFPLFRLSERRERREKEYHETVFTCPEKRRQTITAFTPYEESPCPLQGVDSWLPPTYFQARCSSASDAGAPKAPPPDPLRNLISDKNQLQMLDIQVRKRQMARSRESAGGGGQGGGGNGNAAATDREEAVEEILEALYACNYSVMPPEVLTELRKVIAAHAAKTDASQTVTGLVSQQGIKALQELDHPHLHQLLYGVMRIPCVDARLECMVFEATYNDSLKHCYDNLMVLHSALERLGRRRGAVRRFFGTALNVGNALNKDSSAPMAQHGFRLCSLKTFQEARSSSNPRLTLFHFVLLLLEREEVRELCDAEDLEALRQARLARSCTVHQVCTQLLTAFAEIERLVDTTQYKGRTIARSNVGDAFEQQDSFHEHMRKFVERGRCSARSIRVFRAHVFANYRELSAHFADPKAVYPPPRTASDPTQDLFDVFYQFFDAVAKAEGDVQVLRQTREVMEKLGLEPEPVAPSKSFSLLNFRASSKASLQDCSSDVETPRTARTTDSESDAHSSASADDGIGGNLLLTSRPPEDDEAEVEPLSATPSSPDSVSGPPPQRPICRTPLKKNEAESSSAAPPTSPSAKTAARHSNLLLTQPVAGSTTSRSSSSNACSEGREPSAATSPIARSQHEAVGYLAVSPVLGRGAAEVGSLASPRARGVTILAATASRESEAPESPPPPGLCSKGGASTASSGSPLPLLAGGALLQSPHLPPAESQKLLPLSGPPPSRKVGKNRSLKCRISLSKSANRVEMEILKNMTDANGEAVELPSCIMESTISSIIETPRSLLGSPFAADESPYAHGEKSPYITTTPGLPLSEDAPAATTAGLSWPGWSREPRRRDSQQIISQASHGGIAPSHPRNENLAKASSLASAASAAAGPPLCVTPEKRKKKAQRRLRTPDKELSPVLELGETPYRLARQSGMTSPPSAGGGDVLLPASPLRTEAGRTAFLRVLSPRAALQTAETRDCRPLRPRVPLRSGPLQTA